MSHRIEGGTYLRGQVKRSKPGQPLVSVITATYNAAAHLPAAIQSIRGQAYDNIEYIVVDGASTDGTVDVIRANEDVIGHWVSEPDTGIYDAWNKGLRLAHGDWIAFLGADDVYLAGAIEAYVNAIGSCGDRSPQYLSSRVSLTSGSKVLRTVGQEWNWRAFRRRMNVAHVGSLHHRSLFALYGGFDESYRICGDYEFLLRAGPDLRAAYLHEVTVSMRVGGMSNASVLALQEAARAKTATAGRSALICKLETYWAMIKWKLRTYLWITR